MRQGLSPAGAPAGTDSLLVIGAGMRHCRRATPLLVALTAFICTVQAAPVATLEWTRGVVVVGHGDGFARGGEGVSLDAGDRVLVTEGAEAVVVFNDGCKARLEENTLYTLQSASCQGGPGDARLGFYYASAIGAEVPPPSDGGGDTPDNPKPAEAPAEKPADGDTTSPIGASNMWTAVGLTAAAGVAMYAITAGGGGASSPAPSDPRDNLSPQ